MDGELGLIRDTPTLEKEIDMEMSKERMFRLVRAFEMATIERRTSDVFAFGSLCSYWDATLGMDRAEVTIASAHSGYQVTSDEILTQFVDEYELKPQQEQDAFLGLFLLTHYGMNPIGQP